ncbi:MAG: hypothetical protein ABIH35_00375 [Patescibacteria group bacterium]
MKKKLIALIAVLIILLTAAAVMLFSSHSSSSPKFTYPPEYKLNVTHVSDTAETAKYGKQVGGNCYLAATTMLLKSFDPQITFLDVFVYQGNGVSFSYYFPRGPQGGTAAGLMDASTDILLTAASNLGFTPHLRMRMTDRSMGTGTSWQTKIKELGGDLQSYLWSPPLGEYKQIISGGIPLATDGSPCHNDYHVIEGYNEDELFAVIPDPEDVDRDDPKISCPVGSGLRSAVFWFTPDRQKLSDRELMLVMKESIKESLENMERYIKNLKEGTGIISFTQNIYLGRKFASMYLQEHGYPELAAAYKKSSELLFPLTSIFSSDIGEHKDQVISQMDKVFKIERGLTGYWDKVN